MNLFEFSELLRRQKKLLIAGATIIVLLVAFMSFEYDNGVRLRAQPRYESSIQMAVVPAGFESLGSALPNVGAMSGTAVLYATLLASQEAAINISQGSGVFLLDTLQVTTSGDDGFIDVKATASDPESAILAALYSFEWLKDRVSAPPSIVRPSGQDVEVEDPLILDENGQFVGSMRIEASPAFADTATGLWIGLTTPESAITLSLADAGERVYEYAGLLEPGTEMTITLQDVFGNELDSVIVDIPAFPEPGTLQHELVVTLNRGLLSDPIPSTGIVDGEVIATTSVPSLLERHLGMSWQPVVPAFAASDEVASSDGVGLLLLTEAPLATVTGGRKGPILILGALIGGFFALITFAVGADTWRRSKQESQVEEFTIADLTDRTMPTPAKERVGER
jgi:hypothetical protein